MATKTATQIRHDRGPDRYLTPIVPGTALALEWCHGLSSRFRSSWTAARRAILRETALWFLGTRRLRPILVVAVGPYAATHLRSRGHFHRI